MRGSFGLLRNSNGVLRSKVIGEAAKLVSCSTFSTLSSGSGQGRGQGSFGAATFDFIGGGSQSGEIESNEGVNDLNQSFSSMGRGHGRGKPFPSSPALPSFNSFVASDQPLLPQTMLNVLPGSGIGMPVRKSVSDEKPTEQNRHLRARGDGSVAGREKDRLESKEGMPKLSREEAVMRAMGILAKQDDNSGGRGRGRGREIDEGSEESEDENEDFMGDDADCEELAQKLGPARISELTVAFEDLSTNVLPDPVMGECINALNTNLQIELEPEYMFGDFEMNPNINETPPISLEDALEKMKPFLMAYEGFENEKDWEEVMKETMEKVPLMKEIVDHYCGPDRVTAKQQQAELERVAKTLPASARDLVVPFTDRAVRSLQSNPGWGFNKKFQLMDKMVAEFSNIYR